MCDLDFLLIYFFVLQSYIISLINKRNLFKLKKTNNNISRNKADLLNLKLADLEYIESIYYIIDFFSWSKWK